MNQIPPAADAAFFAELAQLRLQAGLSRQELAEQVGIKTADVIHSEAGQRHVDVVELFHWCQVCASSLEAFAERLDLRQARATGLDSH